MIDPAYAYVIGKHIDELLEKTVSEKNTELWQPIETHPQDGTAFLVMWAGFDYFGSPPVTASYDVKNENLYEIITDIVFEPDEMPSHWMLLPEPPK